MKANLAFALIVGATLLAGCSSTVRTLEYSDGKLSMTEVRDGHSTYWELKEVSSVTEVKSLRGAGWQREGAMHHQGAPDTFLMKRRVSPRTAAVVPPFQPMLITTPGTSITTDGTWRIGVSESALDFAHMNVSKVAPGLTVSNVLSTSYPAPANSTWTAHTGWFVYIENESRVWVYDGDRRLMLESVIINGNNSSGGACFDHFPCPVPAEVFSRLTVTEQEAVRRDK
jgi:hypothetical protein